jgi:hypothetical protein
MSKTLKTILIVLALLIAITLVLKTLGFVGKVTGSILMAPIHLLIGLLGAVVGLVGGAIGLLVGLLGALIGLGVLLIPLLLAVGFVVFVIWILGFLFKGSGRKDRPFDPDQWQTREDIRSGIRRMQKRIESLETILSRDKSH